MAKTDNQPINKIITENLQTETVALKISNSTWSNTFFYASAAIICVMMVIASQWYGLSGDEAYANGMGKAAWKFISSFGADQSVFNQPDSVNRDGVLTYYGNIFDIICLGLNKISPFSEYDTRHFFNAFVGFLGIFFSARIIKDYWGTVPACICMWLMSFYPFYMGHAMNNPKDVPMAAFYIMGIYFLLRFFKRLADLSIWDYVWLIIAIVLAIDVRVAGILLIAYMPILFLFQYKYVSTIMKQKGIIKTFLPLAIVAISSYFLCAIFWPYAAQNPISNPLNALAFLSDFKIELGQIWEGEKLPSGQLPGNYLLRCIYMTSPYVFLVGLVLATVLLFINRKNIIHLNILLFIGFTGVFPLLYIMNKGSNVYHLWRHVLFVFPSLAIVASLGYYLLSNFFKTKPLQIGAFVLFGILLLEPILFTAKTFPNNVNYFNASVGGVDGAYGQYEMDFYYNSMKPCVDYLEKNILPTVSDSITIGTNAVHLLDQYFKDTKYKIKNRYVRFPEKNTKEWDYGIFHISLVPLPEVQAGNWASYNNPIFTSTINDKPLCVLLKRPSKEDLAMIAFLEQKNYPAAYQSCLAYLQKDPQNPMVLDLKNKLEAAVVPAK
jgi:Dolichyl-phosphate-mannose-protein mannosyltransferase